MKGCVKSHGRHCKGPGLTPGIVDGGQGDNDQPWVVTDIAHPRDNTVLHDSAHPQPSGLAQLSGRSGTAHSSVVMFCPMVMLIPVLPLTLVTVLSPRTPPGNSAPPLPGVSVPPLPGASALPLPGVIAPPPRGVHGHQTGLRSLRRRRARRQRVGMTSSIITVKDPSTPEGS